MFTASRIYLDPPKTKVDSEEITKSSPEPVAWVWMHQLKELQEWRPVISLRAWSGKYPKPNGLIPIYTEPPKDA